MKAHRIAITAVITFSLALATIAVAQMPKQNQASSLDELLGMVKKGTLEDRADFTRRENEFKAARNEQANLLDKSKKRRSDLEARGAELENTFELNETTLATKQETLNKRLGSLKELFGVFQQVAGDAQGLFHVSITSAQFPNRGQFLEDFAKKMSKASKVYSIEEIERLWFELQREMTESGKIVSFKAPVTLNNGDVTETEVVRVGMFNVIADGSYLNFSPDSRRLFVLQRQPAGRHQSSASNFQAAKSGMEDLSVDPSRGSILSLLIQTPGLWERTQQGGLIGFITLGLGFIGMLFAIERLVTLTLVGRAVDKQVKSDVATADNPLGRVLKVADANPATDPDTLERKLGEAILKEIPRLNRFLVFLKIIAVVAPLLGLLGTVTGMINTFQAITLFGTGDPKLMAGGISQALVTTVIGLCVAIPTLLLHSAVASRSKRVVHILEEQSAGLIATRAEKKHAA